MRVMASNIHLVAGDEFLATEKSRELLAGLVDDPRDPMALETIDGQADSQDQALQAIGRCLEALMTVGFFGGRKAVWFRGVSFLTDNKVGRLAGVKAALTRLAERLKDGVPAEVGLVVSTVQIDKRYALYKALQGVGTVHDVSLEEKKGGGNPVRRLLDDTLKTSGATMSEDAREAFLMRVGADGRTLVSEVNKLLTYIGDRRAVAMADVVAITSHSREAVAWDIQDAFGERDTGRAMGVLRQLLFQRETPMGVIFLLEGRIRELIVLREALDRRWVRLGGGRDGLSWDGLPPEGEWLLGTAFGKDPRGVHPYRLRRLLEQARGFTLTELRRCQQAAMLAHRRMVTTSLPPALVLETFLLQAVPARRG